MVELQFPYLQRVVTKGRVYYRYRRGGRVYRLPKDPTSPDFFKAYHKIHASFERAGKAVVASDSVRGVIETFKRSPEYLGLSKSTRSNYKTHLNAIDDLYGDDPIAAVNRGVVLAFRDSMVTKPTDKPDKDGELPKYPARANYAYEVFRRLLSFAMNRGMIDHNPALDVDRLKTGAYKPWAPEQIEAFRKVAPERLVFAMDIALYTGQRLGDILNMTWAQVDGGWLHLTQGKTGAELSLPIHPVLAAAMAKQKENRTSTHIVTTATGKPYKVSHFKHEWARAAKRAGLKNVVFHGLRKTVASRLAEAGCTHEQIKAITGHKTDAMVSHYTAGANQKKRALAAMEKLESVQPTSRGVYNFPKRKKK